MRTRLAPTPSGYLHLGNLLNFQLTADLARQVGLELALRIDDADQTRVRPEYVLDIFRWLDALGIKIDIGPHSPSELAQDWTQVARYERYWHGLAELQRAGVEVFVCGCSRTQLEQGSCNAGCHGELPEWIVDQNVVRWRAPIDLRQGDPVLWRRDGIPAYHLTNIFDDLDLGITHVVRGADLAESSRLHEWLNARLGVKIKYLHHALVSNLDGGKLSKSQGAAALVDTAQLRIELGRLAEAELPRLVAQFRT